MAANRQSLSLAAIGTRLAALCDPNACAPVASTDATGWRQPDDLVPFQYLLPKHRDDRCWGCGSPTRQPWGEPREAPLRKCSGCRVAVYCGAKCAASSWAGRHRLACKSWRTFAKEVPMLCDEYPSSIHSIDARARACARESLQWDLSGDWRTDWSWPKEFAAAVLAAGLTLVEVVVVVDPGAWEVQVQPAVEYGHHPAAIPAAMLAAAGAKHGGRVLRVVYRQHPPLMRVFGPRSLGLGD